jgi:hypothetical protein
MKIGSVGTNLGCVVYGPSFVPRLFYRKLYRQRCRVSLRRLLRCPTPVTRYRQAPLVSSRQLQHLIEF